MVPAGAGPAPPPPARAACPTPAPTCCVSTQPASAEPGSPGPASQTTPPAEFRPSLGFALLGSRALASALCGGPVASVLGCEGHLLRGRGQILGNPRHLVQPAAPNGAQAIVTSLGDSGEPPLRPSPVQKASFPWSAGKIPGYPPDRGI